MMPSSLGHSLPAQAMSHLSSCLLWPWTQSLPSLYLLAPQDLEALPPHDTTSELADAMALAAQTAGSKGGLILFVVQPGEINSYDQQVCPSQRALHCSSFQGDAALDHTLSSLPAAASSTAFVCWQAQCCHVTCCA